MTGEEKNVRIEEALRSRGVESEITCAEALALAKELDVDPLEVGRTLTSMNIKIRRCQLGCFGWQK